MLNVSSGSYLVIGEMDVQWVPSATMIPDEEPPKAVYSVWLMDSLGIRAAVFVRCPTCQTPLGVSPGDLDEQKDWNKKKPVINTIMGCGKCSNFWMITSSRAYHLVSVPAAPDKRIPRPLVLPPKGGMA